MTDTVTPKIPFTRAAYEKMQQDHARLTKELGEVMERLQTAREMGDLSENGAYQYAKFEMGSIRRQLNQLNHLLDTGEIVTATSHQGKVGFGSQVTLKQDTKEVTYTLVSMHESSLKEKKLSIESPLGKSLMGKQVGDTVVVIAPAGEMQYLITSVK
jgi:transcription elongation factor GreA